MWSDDDGPYEGKHYRLERTLNSPQPLTKPHPPILIGGGGEKKTLRLVAQYAQACNLFSGPGLEHKLDVLREHCADGRPGLRRDREDGHVPARPRPDGENVDALLEELRRLAALGIEEAHGIVPEVWKIAPLERLGRDVVPVAAEL